MFVYEEISLLKLVFMYFFFQIFVAIILVPIFYDALYIKNLIHIIANSIIIFWFYTKIKNVYNIYPLKMFFNNKVKKIDPKIFKIIISIILITNISVIAFYLAAYHFFDFGIFPEFIQQNLNEALEEVILLLPQQTNFYVFLDLISVILIAPIIEEIIFRGILFNKFKKRLSFKATAIILSLFWALLHPQNIFGAFIFSLCLFYIMEKYNDLFLCIGIHFFNNLIVYFIDYSSRIFESEIQYIHNLYFPIILIVLITLLYIKVYKSIRSKNISEENLVNDI
jgi:hypothetical protein